MKRNVGLFGLGFLLGAVATYFGVVLFPYPLPFSGRIPPEPPPICHSCFWEGYYKNRRAEFVDFYRKYETPDPLVAADVRYILWRATQIPYCEGRQAYRDVAENDTDLHRRLMARAILGFSGPECGQNGSGDLRVAAKLAKRVGLAAESTMLDRLSEGRLEARFEDTAIVNAISIPPEATAMILGESTVFVPQGMRVGTQVERVARDWVGREMDWDLSGNPLPFDSILNHHEGTLLRRLMTLVPVEVYPLAGTLIAQKGEQWFAPDETGIFRFEVLLDKVQYPTTHAFSSFGWIEDTHGISALVSQSLGRHMQLVVACGDSPGKAQAAFYLAQKGVNVLFPADRYQDLLLGYQGNGVLLGTAPMKSVEGRVVIGHQPIRFLLEEPIVAQDTKQRYPYQYYDAAARYFRRLREMVPINVVYVEVDGPNQIDRVLDRAAQLNSSAVAVRIATKYEYETLRDWLGEAANNRAILFHSGLYPYAQPLFDQYPQQVTFGDLRPRFE